MNLLYVRPLSARVLPYRHMKRISSSQNPVLKNLRALGSSAKARRDQGQTILEGVHLAESYLASGQLPELCVVSDSSTEVSEVAAILRTCTNRGVRVALVNDSLFRSISTVENSISIIFVINTPEATPSQPIMQTSLLLDTVQDPGNLGTMLRTAAAAGVRQVYCSAGTTAAWAPKVLRAGMGAHFALTVYESCDLAGVIREAEIPVYATTLEAKTTIYEADLSSACAWVMGSEGQGVSRDLLALNVGQLYIPQAAGVESLNVAAAAAVCLFEQRRQQLAVQ